MLIIIKASSVDSKGSVGFKKEVKSMKKKAKVSQKLKSTIMIQEERAEERRVGDKKSSDSSVKREPEREMYITVTMSKITCATSFLLCVIR